LLYAHDVAGERFQQADAVRGMSALARARGALVLLDPFSLRAVESTLEGQDKRRALIDPSAESPQSVVERFLQALRESGRDDVKKLPVVVVLSKADALSGADGLSPGDHGDVVSRWLEANGGGNLVRLLEAEFDTCEFFAVSALGRLPDPADQSAFSPNGTLEPFFWLLKANKIAVGDTAQATTQTVTEQLESKEGARRVVPWPSTPILAPTPKSGGGYAAGVVASLLIFAGIIGLIAGLSGSNSPAYANTSNTASGSGTSSNSGSGTSSNSGSGTSSDNTPSDAAAIVGVLHSYATDYTNHDTQGLASIFASNVQRRGLAAGGCTVDHGQTAVLGAYQSQFNEGTGTYKLLGLSTSQVQFNAPQTATVGATYQISPGGTGSVAFTLSKSSGSWQLIRIYATCA
jgi:hypothetical protein